MRHLSGLSQKIVIALTVGASLFHLYTAATGVLEPRLQRGFHLLFLLPLAFLLYPMTRRAARERIPWYDWLLAGLAALPSLYIILDKDRLNERWEGATEVTTLQMVLGVIIVVTLIEAVRRSTAPALAVLMILALGHLAFGHHLPGFLYHKEFGWDWVVETAYLLDDEGIYGSITGVSAVFVALFVIFGAFIHELGLGQYFIDLACRLAGRSAGGPAKVAVISSSLFGTISGAAAANVFATGTFSIPLMRRVGYRAQFAAAVEAAASTGGQLMPPIMGASAFLMAQITQTPYLEICKAALPAALLYFLCVGVTVHYEALRHGLRPVSDLEVVPLGRLVRGVYLFLPVVALLALMVIGYSPFMGAFVGTLVCVGISVFDRSRWMTPSRILTALERGGRNLIMIACAVAGAGLIISVVVNTGLGLQFSNAVIAYAHDFFPAALFFIMMSAIILGMGLPTTAAYVLAVSVGGPTLIEMGGETLAVHLFVFYFAIMACVTPPVALAAYAGASVANTEPLRTGFEASRIAVAGYLIPFMFIYQEGILLRGSLADVLLALAVVATATYLLVLGSTGWMLTRLSRGERVILVIAALVVAFPLGLPDLHSVILGLALITLLYALQRHRRGKTVLAPERGSPSSA